MLIHIQYDANVSVLCFPSKACLCSPVFLRIIRTAVLLWPGQCRETSYYVSYIYMVEFKPVSLFSKPSISWQSRAMFNKRFRVLYAMVAPGPRTRNRINPVVLHESLQSTISWLLCLEWINCVSYVSHNTFLPWSSSVCFQIMKCVLYWWFKELSLYFLSY